MAAFWRRDLLEDSVLELMVCGSLEGVQWRWLFGVLSLAKLVSCLAPSTFGPSHAAGEWAAPMTTPDGGLCDGVSRRCAVCVGAPVARVGELRPNNFARPSAVCSVGW